MSKKRLEFHFNGDKKPYYGVRLLELVLFKGFLTPTYTEIQIISLDLFGMHFDLLCRLLDVPKVDTVLDGENQVLPSI